MIGRDKVGQLGLGYLFATGYVATVIRIYLSYLQMLRHTAATTMRKLQEYNYLICIIFLL